MAEVGSEASEPAGRPPRQSNRGLVRARGPRWRGVGRPDRVVACRHPMARESYDYVIVGAGSAGCVLAARLTEDPSVRVLLLEAGGEDRRRELHIPAGFVSLFKSKLDWAYETEPEPGAANRTFYWPRGKVLGGSSSINAMLYIRGNRRDYDRWAAWGNAGWHFDGVLPYFKRAEDQSRGSSRLHGVGGPLRVSDPRSPSPLSDAFLRATEAAGYPTTKDFNGPEQDGFGFFQVTQRNGMRASTAVAYLRPARQRPNLTVRTHAMALGIEMEGTAARGVRYTADDDVHLALAEREVLLAGGAINSPQLLMLSGIGPASALEAHGLPVVVDLPAVGQNLQDHPAVPIVFRTHRDNTLDSAETLANLLRYVFFRRGPFTTTVCEAAGFLRSREDLEQPDLQINFLPTALVDHGFDQATDHGIDIAPTLLLPESQGEVTLRSADPREPVRIRAGYLEAPGDRRALIAGVRIARRIAAAPPLAKLIDHEVLPGSDVDDDDAMLAFIGRTVQTLYHPVSTCRMGPEPGGARPAVVDPSLRVHGTERLRVVDASVMPAIPAGNTNAPTIMIAEKAADLIRGLPPLQTEKSR